MQNTSPGPEGKEREGKRGKEGRGLNMNADTSPSWPIVCRVSVLETGDMPHRADKLGVYRAPSAGWQGPRPFTTLYETRGI